MTNLKSVTRGRFEFADDATGSHEIARLQGAGQLRLFLGAVAVR
ncbi:MAG: hypothetical protein O2782_14315 [bacterium]|nr:hypothetical protein [bacterium]